MALCINDDYDFYMLLKEQSEVDVVNLWMVKFPPWKCMRIFKVCWFFIQKVKCKFEILYTLKHVYTFMKQGKLCGESTRFYYVLK